MIIINTIDERHFELNGLQYAKIYQPLKSGLENLAIYNVFETRQQLQNSERFDQYQIDGSVPSSQADAMAKVIEVTYSKETVYNYYSNQGSTYATIAEAMAVNPLPADNISFTVQNEVPTSEDGYYIYLASEAGGYLKTGNIEPTGEVAEGEARSVSGDKINEALKEKAGFEQTKNLFKGLVKYVSLTDTAIYDSGTEGRMIIDFIPVEYGKHYTISGLDPSLAASNMRVVGTENALTSSEPVTEYFGKKTTSTVTVLIDDVNTNFLTVQVSTSDLNIEAAEALLIQVEESETETSYFPPELVETAEEIIKISKDYTDEELQKGLSQKADLQTTRNLFTGLLKYTALTDTAVVSSGTEGRMTLDFVPVEYGKYYTVSGLDYSLINNNMRFGGTANASNSNEPLTEYFGKKTTNTVTVLIDNPLTKFLICAVNWDTSTIEQAEALKIQVEEGQIETEYRPPILVETGEDIIEIAKDYTDKQIAALESEYNDELITDSQDLDTYNTHYSNSELGVILKSFAPKGIYKGLNGELLKENLTNNIFTRLKELSVGNYDVFAYVDTRNNAGASQVSKIDVVPFSTPSGQLDSGDILLNPDIVGYDCFVHPDIDYNVTGVGGFKYWMVASILPAGEIEDGATSEDEDVFVTNTPDVESSWQRVRSLYETDKDYTTTVLRLPHVPNTWSTNGRRNALLPTPKAGVVIEVSTLADNGYPAQDAVNKTISLTRNPYKHDPALIMHGGYVYILNCYQIYYNGEAENLHKFLVLIRSSDGVNWESVRSDGTTWALDSEAAVEEIFTKDSVSGKFNYWFYGYKNGNTNPCFVTYASNDINLVWGYNNNKRYGGTTPYDIDLTTDLGIQDLGSGNHPAIFYVPSEDLTYHLDQDKVAYSSDRGVNFTSFDFQPNWIGGLNNLSYKKSLCVGEGGEIVLIDTKRISSINPASHVENQTVGYIRTHKVFVQVYASITEFVNYANNGLDDGYIDLQIEKVNFNDEAKKLFFVPYVGNKVSTTVVLTPFSKVKILDNLEIIENDEMYFYITLNARTGGAIKIMAIEFNKI